MLWQPTRFKAEHASMFAEQSDILNRELSPQRKRLDPTQAGHDERLQQARIDLAETIARKKMIQPPPEPRIPIGGCGDSLP